MDYEKAYYNLMQKRKTNVLDKSKCYCEKHHIIPKSLGGSNAKENLVNLTPREHIIAHRFLEKFTQIKYGKNSKQYRSMAQALWFMLHDKKYPNVQLTSKEYDAIRKRYSQSISGKNNRWHGITGQLSPLYGKKQSEKSKNANSISHIGRKHMHDPITDKAVFVKPNEIQSYLQKGYVIGMSQHERNSISKRNTNVRQMYDPITDKQVYAQQKDIQTYLDKGFVFGKSNRQRNLHSKALQNRLSFYDINTHKRFYVKIDQFESTLQQGHIPSKSSIEKMKLKGKIYG